MKTPILTAAVAGLIAGVSGAFLVQLVGPAPQSGTETNLVTPGTRPKADGETTDWSRQIDRLAAENADLTARLAQLENARSRNPVPATGELEEVALGDDLAGLAASLRTGQATEDFQLLVEDVIASIEEREAQKRAVEQDLRIQDMVEVRLEGLTEKLGLSGYQVKEMRTVLFDQEKKRQEIFTAARQNDDFRSARDSFRTLRNETEETLGTILTPEQLEEYRSEDRGGRRGGGAPNEGQNTGTRGGGRGTGGQRGGGGGGGGQRGGF